MIPITLSENALSCLQQSLTQANKESIVQSQQKPFKGWIGKVMANIVHAVFVEVFTRLLRLEQWVTNVIVPLQNQKRKRK